MRHLALIALCAVVGALGALRLANWLDYWERQQRGVEQ